MLVPLNLESFIGPFVSALLVGGGAWVALRVVVARIETRQEERERLALERHQENQRRFQRLEDAMGISEGNGAAFVRKGEWVDAQRNICERISNLVTEVHEAIRDGREAVRVGQEDRAVIKERLTKVEATLARKRR